MSYNIRQTALAVSRVKQSDLVTASGASDMFRLTKRNQDISEVSYVVDSDAQDIGKDDEFAVNSFKINKDGRFRLEADCTSELAAWAFVFGLGSSTDSAPAAGSYRHTAVPQSASIDLMPFTVAEKLPSDGAGFDRAIIGCVIDGFTLSMNSGPGRDNSTISVDCVSTGKTAEPSGITLPSPITLHRINAGSLGLTIIGVNYVTGGRIVSLEWSWRNNVRLDQGFYPGSGSQDGFQLRGRMEHGDRETTLRIVARLESDSAELDKLAAQTEGTVVITGQGDLITGSTYHDISITFHRVTIGSLVISNDQGIATVQFDLTVKKHSSNGVVTAYATNELALFGAET